MAHRHRTRHRAAGLVVLAALTLTAAACSSATPGRPESRHLSSPRGTSLHTSPAARTSGSVPASSSPARSSSPKPAATSRTSAPHPASAASSAPHAPSASQHVALPLDLPTHDARQLLTVVATSEDATTAVLQRWTRGAHGWQRVGASTTVNLGSDGLSRHPSESRSATPIGSFTLTSAFGHDADPGTRLPYTRTTPDDWWISQPGPLYNTRQRCASDCDFTRGDPNEHLFYETPAYDYAAVIDYNTRNAPGGVHQGAGSAFFLHVSEGVPTAGCVSVPRDRLLTVLRWLRPAAHPRILIGVG